MKILARILAFYFLLGGLMPGSDFGQLGRMFDLLEHFHLHRQMAAQNGRTLSFSSFVAAHFWQPDSHRHNDGGQSHQELPLKSVQVFSQILPGHFFLQLAPPFLKGIKHFPPEERLLPAGYSGAIFRPPMPA